MVNTAHYILEHKIVYEISTTCGYQTKMSIITHPFHPKVLVFSQTADSDLKYANSAM